MQDIFAWFCNFLNSSKHWQNFLSGLTVSIIHPKKKRELYRTEHIYKIWQESNLYSQSWSVVKWVWPSWNSFIRNSINWADLLFAGSLRSFCRKVPRKRKEYRFGCLLWRLITFIYVEVAATWDLAKSKYDQQDQKCESWSWDWNPHDSWLWETAAEEKRREEIVIDTKKEAKASNWIEVCNKGRGMCCVLLYIDEATCVVSEQRAKTPN